VLVGCALGSTTAKAVVLSSEREMLFSSYSQSEGNPIEDAKALFRQLRRAGFEEVAALAVTGYGKDLLKDVIGADLGIVETVALYRTAESRPSLTVGLSFQVGFILVPERGSIGTFSVAVTSEGTHGPVSIFRVPMATIPVTLLAPLA
jgi:hypothetical protein